MALAAGPACSSDDAPDGVANTGGFAPFDYSTGGLFAGLGSRNGAGGNEGTGGSMGGSISPGTDCLMNQTFLSKEASGITAGDGVYTYVDTGGSCISIVAQDGEVCAKGTAAQVVNNMWDTIFGAGVGVQLLESGGTLDASEYRAITFEITEVPPNTRAGVMMSGDGNLFFSYISAGKNTLLFDELENGSWVEEPGTLDLTKLTDIQWHIASTDARPVEFDFCMSDISFVTEAGLGGASGSL